MGHKIFVSYKYADAQVEEIPDRNKRWKDTTCRDYVDIIEELIGEDDFNIYKGEKDDSDLSRFKDATIESKLRDKIYDSSVTIVLISKGMKDKYKKEEDQWIPWEISYSLKEISRGNRTSRTNGILGVLIPDENGSYDYIIEKSCEFCNLQTYKTDTLFEIIGNNMFNVVDEFKKEIVYDSDCFMNHGSVNYPLIHSYIIPVKWEEFIDKYNDYIELAFGFGTELKEYFKIQKEVRKRS